MGHSLERLRVATAWLGCELDAEQLVEFMRLYDAFEERELTPAEITWLKPHVDFLDRVAHSEVGMPPAEPGTWPTGLAAWKFRRRGRSMRISR